MANPSFLEGVKLPLTPKPTMTSVGEFRPTYNDLFNIQNTIRILMRLLVEEAPEDGFAYERKNGDWVVAGDVGSVSWGNISGNIADQLDLTTLLSGYVPEAPEDTILYGRKDGNWVEIPTAVAPTWGVITGNLEDQVDLWNVLQTTADDITLVANRVTALETAIATKIDDAPADGKQYVRKDGAWEEIIATRFPLVTGEVPPVFVYLDDGNLVWTP